MSARIVKHVVNCSAVLMSSFVCELCVTSELKMRSSAWRRSTCDRFSASRSAIVFAYKASFFVS